METTNTIEEYSGCQAHKLAKITEPISRIEIMWQFRNRLKRFLKRRFSYLRNRFIRTNQGARLSMKPVLGTVRPAFKAGQHVRVKTREEIQATLDTWNHLKGCGFMEEMWQYCGTRQQVLKPVERFLDESDYRVKKAKGIVLLEGVHCLGTIDFGRCDRNCYYFWRVEWLVSDDSLEPQQSDILGSEQRVI
jgi:hypothetical protein